MRLRPRLSAVLMLVNVAVITLPLGSIFFFRIYENQLIQETERELISQAALIAADYQSNFRFVAASAEGAAAKTRPRDRGLSKTGQYVSIWTPIAPQLDLAVVDTLPARPDVIDATVPSSALAVSAGRSMTPVLKQAQLTTLAGIRVLDEHGNAVGGTAEIGKNFAHIPEVARALRGEYASALRFRELKNAPSGIGSLATISRGTKVRVFVAFPILDAGQLLGAVYLSRTPKSVLRHMYEERDKAILALVTVLLLSLSLAVLTSRTISRPVGQLLDRTGRVARGETATMAPLERPGTREMEELSDGIGKMADALVERAAYIRTLASHVSHEFKTPLASIQGATELLQDHHDTMSPDERLRFLENISDDGKRLKVLLDRLLDLARAENTVRTDERVALAPLAARALGTLPETVTGTADVPDGIEVQIDDEAMTIVLTNLVENAAQNGAGAIAIRAQRRDGLILVDVHDDGNGISAANRDKIFEHFFTTRRDQGGTGLGLGIVRALLAAHRGGIVLAETGPEGSRFRITLQA